MSLVYMVSNYNNICILQSAEANESFESWKQMKANCPLIPIPPHGRLIDADEMIRRIDEEVAKFVAINEYDSGLRAGYRASKKTVQLLPTIIEAEVVEV